MLKHIGDKAGKMIPTPVTLFNNLSNSDLIAIAEAGELKNFCYALTLDLGTRNEKGTTYEA
tara:strand:- start:1256 stop:1438 length:183 start_codon:yes stop_codon:yes gene_type:complete